SGLKPGEIRAPEGERLGWDATRGEAVSDAYGRLRFATPLIELPIDKVTHDEAAEYEVFRNEYMRLWRQFFDPVGFRLASGEGRTRVEAFILPLVRNEQYDELRRLTGNGVTTLDLGSIPTSALFQFTMRLDVARVLPQASGGWAPSFKEALGERVLIRLDDGPGYRELARRWARRQTRQARDADWRGEARALLRLPVVFGIEVRDREKFDMLVSLAELALGDGGPTEETSYRGTRIRKTSCGPRSQFYEELNRGAPKEQHVTPVLYHAHV